MAKLATPIAIPIKIVPYSPKQLQLLSWWAPHSCVKDALGIIACGAVRSGKTSSMSLSFVEWAFATFHDQNFVLAGKTVGSLRRNVLKGPFGLLNILLIRGYTYEERRTENLLVIRKDGRTNYFYYFGGKDESSQDLIQGITLGGILFDEVTLMPRSFVNQGMARCSVEGSKFWFNCNPDSPRHWFKRFFVDKRDAKKFLHLHFTMDDNPSLSKAKKLMFRLMWPVGVFFRRFILGEWCMAQGAIYDSFDPARNVYKDQILAGSEIWNLGTHYVSIDYGTQNKTVFLHLIDYAPPNGEPRIYVNKQYSYSGRETGIQKVNSEYAADLHRFIGDIPVRFIIPDPSATSFIAEVKKSYGYRVRLPNRQYEVQDGSKGQTKPPASLKEQLRLVSSGILITSTLFARGILQIWEGCDGLIDAIPDYVWDEKTALSTGQEKPIKQDDDDVDALRYGVFAIWKPRRFQELENLVK